MSFLRRPTNNKLNTLVTANPFKLPPHFLGDSSVDEPLEPLDELEELDEPGATHPFERKRSLNPT
jgi:hypothetical protein